MTEFSEPVDFEFVAPSPEQLEADARLLVPLEVLSLPENSARQGTAFGVSLKVPPDLEQTAGNDPGHATWQGGHAYSLTVSMHEGVGQFIYSFEFDGNASAPHEEGVFQISLAGRAAEIVLMRSAPAEHEVYFAAASTAVALDRTVAVFVIAPTEALRARLIATIPTVHVEA